jgi:hypothetical protein
MRAIDLKSGWGRAAGATLGTSALVFTFACSSTRDLSTLTAQPAPPSQAGAPVVVSCEPHQRALVRPTVVDGSTVSQVECVTATAVAAPSGPQPAASAPAGYGPVAQAPVAAPAPRQASRAVESDLGDARVVPARTGTAQTVRTNQVIYDERPVKKTRSVKKSAVIIGSSAGVGAGVGAAIGGKKGALIGAAIGGGGAAVWDQVTRRK